MLNWRNGGCLSFFFFYYEQGARGLYLHGLNKNTCHLQTLDYTHVEKAAKDFGFHCPAVKVFDSISGKKINRFIC